MRVCECVCGGRAENTLDTWFISDIVHIFSWIPFSAAKYGVIPGTKQVAQQMSWVDLMLPCCTKRLDPAALYYHLPFPQKMSFKS